MLVEEKRFYTSEELELLLGISDDLDLIRLISKKELINNKEDKFDLNENTFEDCFESCYYSCFFEVVQDLKISIRVDELLREDKVFKDLYDLNFKR